MDRKQRTLIPGRWLAIALLVAVYSTRSAAPKPPAPEIIHEPASPRPGNTVRISAKVPAGITNLVLQYQVVDPGRYVERKDSAFQQNWLPLAMESGPRSTNTVLFTGEMPASLQVNRRLVRYRFSGRDAGGRAFSLPALNSAVPNYAYFVYAGVPAWTGAIQPRGNTSQLRAPVTFTADVMRRVQSYFLIGKAQSVENVTWHERSMDNEYRYTATLVADGVVNDHVRMRARGGVWRYEMGKNMWKFDFPKSHPLAARDDYGLAYPVPWGQVNLRTCIQQGDYGHRGEQGLFEAVGFRLFNLAGTPAPLTHWIQLRIVTGAEENPADQYRGDFWGLYLAIEEVDGRFLQTHALPDGNVYKMEGRSGLLSHNGAGAVTNRLDLEQFLIDYHRTVQPERWWRAQLNLPNYYSYRAICECIHHYDIGGGKNYYYYLNPADSRWEVIPWDIDLSWADSMFGDGEEPFKRRVLRLPALQIEYQNRLREIRDLLYNPDETGRLIDECAAIIADPAGGPSPVDADRAKWDYHPMMTSGAKAGQGLFYRISPTGDFRGMVQLMKDYVRRRGGWIDARLLNDPSVPATPTLTYTGAPGYGPDKLTFRVSEYRGAQAFAALEWRVAEIAPPPATHGRPTAPGKYEITPAWESGAHTNFIAEVSIPAKAVAGGRTYRARARMKDTTGRWSHWSAPVELKPPATKE